MRFQKHTFLALICIMLSFSLGRTTAFAGTGQERPPLNAELLRALQLVRAQQHLPPVILFGAPSAPAVGGRAAIQGGGAISGMLNGLLEDGPVRAVVVAWAATGSAGTAFTAFGKVDASGAYRFDGLPAGSYYISVQAEGYLPLYYDNARVLTDATPVAVADSSEITGIDFEMIPLASGTGRISGTVLDRGSTLPVGGAQIEVYLPANPFFSHSTVSRDDGTYVLDGLLAGEYLVRAQARGYLPQYYDKAAMPAHATPVAVPDSGEVAQIDFALDPGGTITGVVTRADGTPIPGALVQAATSVSDPGVSPIAGGRAAFGLGIADENGEYEITGLPTGDYFVNAQVWNAWSWEVQWYKEAETPQTATPVHVEQGQTTPDIDFKLHEPRAAGSIAGKVIDAGPDFSGLPDIVINVVPAATTTDPVGMPAPTPVPIRGFGFAITDANGDYVIDNLPAGSYYVVATAHLGWQVVMRWWPDATTRADAQPVAVPDSGEPVIADFVLPVTAATAQITGYVFGQDGTPLAGAFVDARPFSDSGRDKQVIWRDTWATATTDSSGFFVLAHLPAGQYRLHAQYWRDQVYGQQWFDHQEIFESAMPFALAAGDSAGGVRFDLALRQIYGNIAGTITDAETGASISRAYIEVRPLYFSLLAGAPFRATPYFAISDESGTFLLEGLPEGQYYVAAYTNGSFEYFENALVPEEAKIIHVVGGTTVQVDFAAEILQEGNGAIRGRVTSSAADVQPEIAVVIAKPAVTVLVWPYSERFYTAIADSDGSYELAGLPDGEYLVRSFAPGFIGEFYDDTYDPAQAAHLMVGGGNPLENIDFALNPALFFAVTDDPAQGASPGSAAVVHGTVTDSGGQPVPGAQVYLLNAANAAVAQITTGADGRYELQGIPPGVYRFAVYHADYAPGGAGDPDQGSAAAGVAVSPGETTVNFTLSPKTATGTDDGPVRVPVSLQLYGNYPNPFNPGTAILFSLPAPQYTEVKIYDLLGRKIAVLARRVLPQGLHRLQWDGRDSQGRLLPGGVYLYRIVSGAETRTGRMLFLK